MPRVVHYERPPAAVANDVCHPAHIGALLGQRYGLGGCQPSKRGSNSVYVTHNCVHAGVAGQEPTHRLWALDEIKCVSLETQGRQLGRIVRSTRVRNRCTYLFRWHRWRTELVLGLVPNGDACLSSKRLIGIVQPVVEGIRILLALCNKHLGQVVSTDHQQFDKLIP